MKKPKERDLAEVETKLWEVFDEACKNHTRYDDPSYSMSGSNNFKLMSRTALADVAQALAAVKRERRVEKFGEEQQKIEDEMEKGLKAGVTPLNPIKLKQPGEP
jgi:hypothetical protein